MPQEFLAIIIWKSNRTKTKIISGIKESKQTIHEITKELFSLKLREEKLELLTSIKFIGIPMASAILTVLFPNNFTVVDYRAMNSLKNMGIKLAGRPSERNEDYFYYVDVCKRMAKKYKLSLREFDCALWAKDFYEGSGGLKELSESLYL